MTTSAFDEAFKKVKSLAETFHAHKDRYWSSDYKEADVRLDFIDPFLDALGWKRGPNPYQQELKVEYHAHGGTQGRADYAFCIAPRCSDGEERFFLEAKKPHDNLATAGNYHQTISYGYSSRKPLAVLTDFEQFHILDCRHQPNLKTALDHWVDKFDYTDYLDRDRFGKIYWLFSREALTSGYFDAYVKQLSGKKTARAPKPVDESLLERLDELRNALAHAFKKNNPVLDSEALTEFAQRTLDRLVFLRFLEDKGIERQGAVNKFAGSATAWRDFIASCRQLDSIYNGIIYRQQPTLDAPTFRMDNAAFAEVCKRLAHGDTDYNFNFDFIPIHILGSIYERFLGKVIVATDKRVHVEDKPEVRKAGGVYYTPEYIVRYIVENTVGKLIEGKSPAQIAEMRFADIACGSGSFLLAVYDLLLTYHGTWYNANRSKARKGDCFEHDGKLYLSLAKKRDILVKNIYGVDIDAQAVEVCQLSLCLKLLKDESPETTAQYLLDFEHTAQMKKLLPDLSKNIVCGNSLIERNILDGQLKLIANEEEKKLNPIELFPEIVKRGGFDAIIGNPPYRRELDYKHLLDQIALGSFGRKYRSPRMDLWYYFVHRGLEILKPNGVLSYITNAYWTSGTGAEKLITALRDAAHLDEVFFFGNLKVFQNVSGQHMILRVSNVPSTGPTLIKLAKPNKETTAEPFVLGTAPVEAFDKPVNEVFRHGKVDLQPSATGLLAKIERGTPLAELGIVRQGIAENPASINRKTNEKFGGHWQVGEGVFTLRPAERQRLRLSKTEESLLRPYHDLCDLARYSLADHPSLSLIYTSRYTCPDIAKYPRLHNHLKRFRPIMEERRETQNGANSWWHLHWPRDEEVWKSPKIVALQMARRPSFAVARRPVYVPFSVNVFVPKTGISEDLSYFAGVMNSKLLWNWYSHYAKRRGVGLEINGNVLTRTPIRRINFSDPDDKSQHDAVVANVEAMLVAKKELARAKTGNDKTFYENKCADLDRQIDALVYELYGLTEDEIKIVEGEEK
ncbi:MAG: Eco57I restriction-modification methylase domain-containing protein [Verrucomicrobiia bacterium]